MAEKIEQVIRLVYSSWKKKPRSALEGHPDEQVLAEFSQGLLPDVEISKLQEHLLGCSSCAEKLAAALAMPEPLEAPSVAEQLLAKAKGIIPQESAGALMEIILGLAEKAIQIIHTSGDVLIGQELIPAPVLRSRAIKDFKDEVMILKEFKDTVVEAKIENRLGKAFSLAVLAKEKGTQKVLKDIRITLFREGLELESYLAEAGKAVFENVALGKYTVEISSFSEKVASILLEIKKL